MDDLLVSKLSTYKPDDNIKQLIKDTRILLLVGPTGAGKDSLKNKLMATGHYHHIVSHTTRPPRINHGVIEKSGEDYHFIDEATAANMLDKHEFIEAKVYSGNLYGTSLSEIERARNEGRVAMTDLEVQGVAEYKAIDPGVMAVFLLPPNFATWQERLQRRYGDVMDVDDYRLRLQTALDELEELLNTSYYVAVINDDIEETFKHIETVVSSQNHTTPDEPAARAVAEQLAVSIKEYLDKT